jgi:hypothetical protein
MIFMCVLLTCILRDINCNLDVKHWFKLFMKGRKGMLLSNYFKQIKVVLYYYFTIHRPLVSFFFFLFFFVVPEFKLRALCLLGKCSTAWAMPLAPFSLVIWRWGGLTFCTSSLGSWASYFTLLAVAGMTGKHHHTTLSFFPLR